MMIRALFELLCLETYQADLLGNGVNTLISFEKIFMCNKLPTSRRHDG